MSDRNWAEHERTMRDNPSLEDCRKLAISHRGYGWSRRPWGHWSDEQKAAYDKGYAE